jgi:predicted nucleic acid-binding protein
LTVVVDPSLVLKWVLLEDHTEEALELWDRWQSESEHLISPPIFRSEITNALHQRVHRREISPVDAAEMLDTMLSLVDTDEPSVLYDRALALAGSLGQYTVHGSLYLALAELWDCELWTADRRFAKTSRQRSTSVRWVGDDA